MFEVPTEKLLLGEVLTETLTQLKPNRSQRLPLALTLQILSQKTTHNSSINFKMNRENFQTRLTLANVYLRLLAFDWLPRRLSYINESRRGSHRAWLPSNFRKFLTRDWPAAREAL